MERSLPQLRGLACCVQKGNSLGTPILFPVVNYLGPPCLDSLCPAAFTQGPSSSSEVKTQRGEAPGSLGSSMPIPARASSPFTAVLPAAQTQDSRPAAQTQTHTADPFLLGSPHHLSTSLPSVPGTDHTCDACHNLPLTVATPASKGFLLRSLICERAEPALIGPAPS